MVDVGQGLVRRRGLPEDRPARPRDALGRRALRRADRRAARRADRPLADPLRRPRGLRGDPERRDHRASSRSRAARRWPRCVRTRPENLDDLTIQVAIVRPGPIQGGAVNPYIERRQRLRVDPGYEVPYDHPSLEPVLRDTLGTIIFQDQVIEVAMAFAGFSRGRGRGPAPRDEPQALGGGARGPPPALRRGRGRTLGRRRRGARRADLHDDRRASPASASPRRTARRSACSPTSRPGCGCTTARSSSPRCSTSSRWASTRPTRSSTRRSGAASTCCAPDVNASGAGCTVTPEGAVRLGLGHVLGVSGRRGARRWSPSGRPGALRLAGGPGLARRDGAGRRWRSSPGRAPPTASPASTATRGAKLCGAWASPRRPWPPGARARSSPSRSTCPPRRRSIRSATGTR